MKSAWSRVRGLVLFGIAVAALRFILDATIQPGEWSWGWFVGVSFLMPLAFLYVGIRGTMDDIRWPKFLLMSLILGVLVWGIPNLITYTTAQFQGWQFGRFEPVVKDAAGDYVRGHAPPIADSTAGKIKAGLMAAGGSALFTTIGSIVLFTLLVWLPGVIRNKRRARPAA
jgi:hypothetical protein